jgi:hypothetical protein
MHSHRHTHAHTGAEGNDTQRDGSRRLEHNTFISRWFGNPWRRIKRGLKNQVSRIILRTVVGEIPSFTPVDLRPLVQEYAQRALSPPNSTARPSSTTPLSLAVGEGHAECVALLQVRNVHVQAF